MISGESREQADICARKEKKIAKQNTCVRERKASGIVRWKRSMSCSFFGTRENAQIVSMPEEVVEEKLDKAKCGRKRSFYDVFLVVS